MKKQAPAKISEEKQKQLSDALRKNLARRKTPASTQQEKEEFIMVKRKDKKKKDKKDNK